jgi:hypothetical protein
MVRRAPGSAKDVRVIERPGGGMAVPATPQPASVAAARVGWAAALLGVGGLGSSGFVIWRLIETWRVTPAAAAHRMSVLGQRLTYPAANLGAVVVVGLALVGLAVIAMAVSGAVRELAADRRLRRWLRAREARLHAGAVVIEDQRPRAFCAGLVRPRVYISTGALALLDDAGARAVLGHELAHARRRDPLRLACCRVLARALFYVPGLGELHRRQLALAELSADECAIAAAPENRAALARAMLSFAEHSRPEDPTGLDPERVGHLLGDPPGWRFPALVCVLSFTVVGVLGALGVLAGRVAAGTATLALPVLSRQPCVVVLAAIPSLLGLLALRLRRRPTTAATRGGRAGGGGGNFRHSRPAHRLVTDFSRETGSIRHRARLAGGNDGNCPARTGGERAGAGKRTAGNRARKGGNGGREGRAAAPGVRRADDAAS